MVVLYLMRHAQAESAGAGERDHDRPLDGEGQLAAKQLGRALRERGVAPDLVLCSTARRVTETWDAVASEWHVAPEMVADDGLYLAPPQALLSRLSELPSKVRAPLLIGHNPGLFELALSMASDGTPEATAKLALGFPAGAIAAIAFDIADWPQIEAARGYLRWLTTPDAVH